MQFVKTRDVKSPQYSSDGASGLDFFVPNDMAWESFNIYPGVGLLIPSGIMVELESLTCLLATNRSSLGTKGLVVGATLIDEDYRGEIHLSVFNVSKQVITITRGQKLIQFVHIPFYRLPLKQLKDESQFNPTKRRGQGFGSTGTHS